MADVIPPKKSRLQSGISARDGADQIYERRFIANHDGKILGPKFGVRRLDDALGGWMEAGLYIIHGAPGTGKSAFAWQVAAECGMPAVYVSFELNAFELRCRLLARKHQTHVQDIRRGRMPLETYYYQSAALAAQYPNLHTLDVTRGEPPDEVELEATILEARGDHPSALVVMDSLSTWTFGRMKPGMTEYEALNGAVEILEKTAARLDVAILAIAERNRSTMVAGGLSAVAGSRKAEYRSHCVMGLAPAEEGEIKSGGNVKLMLHVAKNHWGPSGLWMPLTFKPHVMEFVDPPKAEDGPLVSEEVI